MSSACGSTHLDHRPCHSRDGDHHRRRARRAGVENEPMRLDQFQALCEKNLARLRELGGEHVIPTSRFSHWPLMARRGDGRLAVLGACSACPAPCLAGCALRWRTFGCEQHRLSLVPSHLRPARNLPASKWAGAHMYFAKSVTSCCPSAGSVSCQNCDGSNTFSASENPSVPDHSNMHQRQRQTTAPTTRACTNPWQLRQLHHRAPARAYRKPTARMRV